MEIRIVSKEDINQVVNVHNSSFKDFFLTELGDHFLSVYYNCVRKDKRGILLGFYEEGKLYGFAAATSTSKSFNTNLILENIFQFSLIGIRLLFTKFSALVRLYNNFTKTNVSINDKGEYAELLSIGVSDKKQGQGIGKKLLLKLEETLKNKGCAQLSLTTDFYDNEKTIGFYNSLGYEIFYDFVAYPKRKMYRLIKRLK